MEIRRALRLNDGQCVINSSGDTIVVSGFNPRHYPKDRSYQINGSEERFNPQCQQNQKKQQRLSNNTSEH